MSSSSSSRLEPRSLDEILDDDKLEYRPPSHTVPECVANDPLRKIKVDLMAVLNASQKPMSALAIERDYAEVNGRRVDPSEFGYDSMEKLLANCYDSIRTMWRSDGSLEYTVVPNERTARLRLQVEQQLIRDERERRKARAEGRPYRPPRKNLPVSESSEDVNDSCYDFMIPMTAREEEKCAKLAAMTRSRSTSVNSEAMADRNHPNGKNGVTFPLAPFVLAGTLRQSKSEFAAKFGDPGDNHRKEVFTPSPFSDKKIAIIIDLIEEYGVKRATGDVQIEISKLRQLYKSRCGTSLAGGEFSARVTAAKMAQLLPDAPWQIEMEPAASPRTGRDVYVAVVKKEEYGNRGGLAVPLPAISPILKSGKKKGDQLEPTPHMQQLKVLKYRALAATNLKALRNHLGFTKQNGDSPSALRIERRVRFRDPEEVREKRESEEERLAQAEEEEEEMKTPADNEQGIRVSEPRLDEEDSEDSMVVYEEETSSAGTPGTPSMMSLPPLQQLEDASSTPMLGGWESAEEADDYALEEIRRQQEREERVKTEKERERTEKERQIEEEERVHSEKERKREEEEQEKGGETLSAGDVAGNEDFKETKKEAGLNKKKNEEEPISDSDISDLDEHCGLDTDEVAGFFDISRPSFGECKDEKSDGGMAPPPARQAMPPQQATPPSNTAISATLKEFDIEVERMIGLLGNQPDRRCKEAILLLKAGIDMTHRALHS